jgi:cell division septum initiation protein DivIVA
MDFAIVKKGYAAAEVDAYIAELKRAYEKTAAEQKERIFELKSALSASERVIKSYKEKSGLVTKAICNAVAKAEEIESLSEKKYVQEIERLRAFHDKWTFYYNKILTKYPLDDELVAAAEFNSQMNRILNKLPAGDTDKVISESERQLEKNYAGETKRADERRIGYINVRAADKGAPVPDDDEILKDMLPDGDLSSPILSGGFDTIERINRYLNAEKTKPRKSASAKKDGGTGADGDGASCFSFDEALNPTDDLMQIMRDLGLVPEE